MRDQHTFIVAEQVKRGASRKRLMRARTAASVAVRDFRAIWTTPGEVSVARTGIYAGRPIVTVSVGTNDYIVSDGDHADLVVGIARLLQFVATNGKTQWPTVPGVGALRATVRDGCAIWELSNGAEFCEIGHLFPHPG